MRAGIATLILGYVLSQFYRAFLAVLAPVLEADLGATKEDLASASGYWFLAFAIAQIPVGSALDRIGPRLTAAVCLGVGAVGAGVFAMAGSAFDIKVAMALIGVGCSPVLMASYFIFARSFSPAAFGTLAGMTIGIGSLGNIAASLPLTAAAEAFGWRETVWALAAITAAMALAVAALVRDPPRVTAPEGPKGSVLTLLAMPQVWPILAMMLVCYAPPGGLRGLWLGPYFSDVWGYDRPEVGMAGLWMGLAMVIGSFAIGPMDRWLGTRKWVIFGGNAAMLAFIAGLAAMPRPERPVRHGDVRGAGLLRVHLSHRHRPCAGLLSAASDGARRDAGQPVRHRLGRHCPAGDGAPLRRHPRRAGRRRALSGRLPVLRRHHGGGAGGLSFLEGPDGLTRRHRIRFPRRGLMR
jgi:MFS family permease